MSEAATGQIVPYREKVGKVRNLLEGMKGQLRDALPRHMPPERMIRVVMTAVQRTPELMDCTQLSLAGAIVQASQLGLEPDGVLGGAYLVPFRNSKTGKREVQLIPGYRGLMDLARRSGQVKTIWADCVYERDKYEFAKGLHPKLEHTPANTPDRGALVAAYAVAFLRDGGEQYEWLWKCDIDKIRQRSKASSSGPWVSDYDAMARKTAIRRLCKYLPLSVELSTALTLDEQSEHGESQHLGDVIDISGCEVVDDDASKDPLDDLADRLQPTPTHATEATLSAAIEAKRMSTAAFDEVVVATLGMPIPVAEMTGEQLDAVQDAVNAWRPKRRGE